MAQFLLDVTHGAYLQQAAQGGTSGHRHAGYHVKQALGFLVDDGAQADMAMVDDFAQSNGIGGGLMAAHQVPGLTCVLVGTEALDREVLPQEFCFELKVFFGRTQCDGDDVFHLLAPDVDFLARRVAGGGLGRAWRIRSSHSCCDM